MRVLLILFLLALYVTLAVGRPAQNEEKEKQTGEAEYDAAESAEEYIQEHQEPIKNEPQQLSYDDHEDSQNEEENDDIYSDPTSEDPEFKNNQQFSDVQKIKGRNVLSSDRHEKDVSEVLFPTKKDTTIYKRTSYKDKTDAQKEEDNLNVPSELNEEDGTIQYKDYPDQDKKEINNYHNNNQGAKQRSIFSMNKESYTRKQGHTNDISEKKNDNSYIYDRSRREIDISNNDKRHTHKNISNEKDLTGIIDNNDSVNNKDSKELSKQELEDLLSSLSIDKINVVKQIINDNENIYKRDITKKAAAVNEASYSENVRLDTKQISEGCDAPDHDESCVPHPPCPKPCPDPCPKPHPKPCDTSNKNSDADTNGTTPSNESELDANQDRSLKEHAKNEASLNGITESKNENNREERDLYSENISNLEGSYDISKHHNLNNYKETVETDHVDDYSEFQKFGSNTLKREISKEEIPDACRSIQSLEESFPNLNSNRNTNVNSDLEPLVRVKRTDNQNDLKEDVIYASFKVPFQSENDFDQQGETNDYEYIEGENQIPEYKRIQMDVNEIAESSRQKRESNVKHNNQVRKIRKMNYGTDNIGIGSDTDNVLTNIEKIGETLTYDRKSRNKRTGGSTVASVSFDTCDTNLGYNRQIIEKSDNLETVNNENGSSDTEADSFGLYSGHKDVNRYKRIRQVNE